MYKVSYTNAFTKDLKRCIKQGYNVELFRETVRLLAESGTLPQRYRPHKLTGNYVGA